MNWNQVEGHWDEVKGKLRHKWGKLTDDDLEQAHGRREQIVARLQQRYGEAKADLEKKVDALIEKI